MRFRWFLAGLGMVCLLGLNTLELEAQATEKKAEVAEQASELVVDEALARRGRNVFRSKGCDACHALGADKSTGPDLIGVLERRELSWVVRFLKDTPGMLDSDPIAIEMLREYRGQRMPNLRLNDQEVDALVHYMAQETARRRGGS